MLRHRASIIRSQVGRPRLVAQKVYSAFELSHPKSGERVLANRKEDLVLGAGMTKPPSDEPE
jgi:hypothetical protein